VAFIGRAINWFADHGITVERVMTDNGTCYRSHAFANTLTAAGVGHLRTRPYRPQTNGKVERLNLILKHEWAYVTAYLSNQARLDALAHWLHHYNHHRPTPPTRELPPCPLSATSRRNTARRHPLQPCAHGAVAFRASVGASTPP
jgi:transposase InsO family protein